MFVIRHKFSGYFLGELNAARTNSQVHATKKKAKQFPTEAAANKHIKEVVKLDAGITDKASAEVVSF